MHISADDLLDALRSEGHRITTPRRTICTVIAAAHDEHLDANVIIERVEAQGQPVDPSTVYRTLEALEAAGVLTHGHLGHRAAVYHLASESDHQHLICDRCGKTLTLLPDDVARWTSEIEAATGFVIDPNHFALTGRCADCSRAGNDATG